MPTQPICCADLSIHLALKHILNTGQGYCFVSMEENRKCLVPVPHCPWCGTELQQKGDRPYAISMAP